MNDIDVNRVLAQIRTLGAQAARAPQVAEAAGAAGASATQKLNGGFQNFLSGAVDRVSQSQSQADQLKRAFELGDPTADLARVMIAGAKAQVEFRGMVEVRNRLVSAYQEIMNMPV